MGLPRSTFYDAPSAAVDDAEIVGRMRAICGEFETYGYRRVGAALRQQGVVVNSKKVRRLMREHDLQPRRRRRFIATTDSANNLPVFPNLARGKVPDGPNELWSADITYVAVASGFVYVALACGRSASSARRWVVRDGLDKCVITFLTSINQPKISASMLLLAPLLVLSVPRSVCHTPHA